ncbi:MAG: large conductance mechanosensitive channel protein MscL [Candidatus Dormibacteraeota bacterium]|nr:large conductance mechanosensitive channel protein MscL [Candidatus Dormibacteraeota bacterium]
MKGFRNFLAQGNVVDLAVAFVIGAAFATVVMAFVNDIVNPLIAIPGGKPNFDAYTVTINGSQIKYGTFVTALISFVLVAAAVYFAFVLPYTRMKQRRAGPAAATTRQCPECLSDIPVGARRCAFCTAQVTPVASS